MASQLASLLAVAVLALVWLEQSARARRRFGAHTVRHAPDRIRLRGWRAALASAYCSFIVLGAFAVPLVQLLVWAVQHAAVDLDARYWEFVWHSLLLASLSAITVIVGAVGLAYAARHAAGTLWNGRLVQALVRLSNLGYALPGMVLSVGLFVSVAWLDDQLVRLLQWQGVDAAPVLRGTVLVMVLALTARFMAVGFNPVGAAMQGITPNQELAARSLGLGAWQSLRALHLPLLRPGLLSAALLVFVEVMKEMPITLLTRPFGWDTLAVRIFEMTSEGMWERAALPSLCVVLAGLLPILLLAEKSEQH